MANTIGRYEIIKEIGRGGMATVYKAYDPRMKREVAIKVLPREFLHDPKFQGRFEREAQTIGSLEHPAIVPVHDFGEFEGQPFLVMRYMDGGTLIDRIKKGKLSLDDIKKIVSRISGALEKAHKQGVIHRDLKPGNILFDEDNNAYLADFGIVKLTEESEGLTSAGNVVGTPSYMSPDQAAGDLEIDGRSDVYSLGVILFELLTGSRPFQAATPVKILMAHLSTPIPDVQKYNDKLPPGTQYIIEKALAKDREDRYQNVRELEKDLITLIATGELKLAPPAIKKRKKSSTRKKDPQAFQPTVDTPRSATVKSGFPNWAISGVLIVVVLLLIFMGPKVGDLFAGLPEGGSTTPSTLTGGAAPLSTSDSTISEEPTMTVEPTETLIPSPTPFPIEVIDKYGHALIYIPAGEFVMGYDEGDPEEGPAHSVYLDHFYIDKYEVTNAQYVPFLNFVSDGKPNGHWDEDGNLLINFQDYNSRIDDTSTAGIWEVDSGYSNYPVVEVTWYGSQQFCEWRGKGASLPSEAQWEKAARGPNNYLYPWGDEFIAELGNFKNYNGIKPVGSFEESVSGYGVHDMAGNVWEWVFDWYANYTGAPLENPTGPENGQKRVERGGSYGSGVSDTRSTYRLPSNPANNGGTIGFRCVIPVDIVFGE